MIFRSNLKLRFDRSKYVEDRQNRNFLYRRCHGAANQPHRSSEEGTRSARSANPTQVLTGKRVFISNSESTADLIFGVPTLTYNVLYEHMKSWGQYELVAAPADADLIFTISFVISLNQQLRLVVLDPKTHVVLWTFAEQVQPWARQATGRKNFDQTMSKLVDDIRKQTTPSAATTDAPAPR